MVTLARQRPRSSQGDVTAPAQAAAACAGAAALLMTASGLLQDGQLEYRTFWHDAQMAVFLVYLFSSMAAVRLAYRFDATPRASAWLIPIGYLLIALGVVLEFIARGPLSWFMAIAGPGLLGSIVGFVVWAVWARHRIRPSWAWLLMGTGGMFAIIFSEFGTSVFVAFFWLLYASRRIEIETAPQPAW